MAVYLVTTAELTSVADSIRRITGESSGITFPNGFTGKLDDTLVEPYYLSGYSLFSSNTFGILSGTSITIPSSSYLEIQKTKDASVDPLVWFNSVSLAANNTTMDSSTYEAVIERDTTDGSIVVKVKSKTGSDIVVPKSGSFAKLDVTLNGQSVSVTPTTPQPFVVTGMTMIGVDFGIHRIGTNPDPIVIPSSGYLTLTKDQTPKEAKLQLFNRVTSVKTNSTTLASTDYETVIERDPATGKTTVKIKSTTGSDITVPVANNRRDLEVIVSGYEATIA